MNRDIHKHHLWSEGRGRFGFLDLYRGIIVLFMIEGHVVRELLSSSLKASAGFSFHELFHGVTAPGFLFGAGFSFAIATQRRWHEAVAFSRGFLRRSWRALSLILLGYALHIPFLSLSKTLAQATGVQWTAFFLFDVLQCIGFGLLFLRLLVFVVKDERWFIGLTIIVLLANIYTTPLLWNTQINQSLPLLLSSGVNGLSGSPFPLFPFMGFLLAGTCVSWMFLRAAQLGREENFIRGLLASGILLIITSYVFDILPFHSYSQYSFWTSSPNYFWMRLGVLFVMLSGLWYFEDFISSKDHANTWMPRWLVVLGIESFFIYIAHLIILCGWVINPRYNLRYFWREDLSVVQSGAIAIILTLIMIPAASIWQYVKKRHHIIMRGIYWWLGFYITYSFFMNAY